MFTLIENLECLIRRFSQPTKFPTVMDRHRCLFAHVTLGRSVEPKFMIQTASPQYIGG